ncbi:vesicle-associated membrane protein 4 (predicted), isoform CRA_c, partial [Rattus norvegicus]
MMGGVGLPFTVILPWEHQETHRHPDTKADSILSTSNHCSSEASWFVCFCVFCCSLFCLLLIKIFCD